MKIIITKDYEEMSAKAFEVMKGVVKNNPYAVLGLATGTTPLGLYRHMTEDHKAHESSYAHIRTVNLDEYLGLSARHVQSYVILCARIYSSIWISRPKIRISRTARRRTSKQSVYGTINYWKKCHGIFSCWAWEATGILRSTSLIRRSGAKRTLSI